MAMKLVKKTADYSIFQRKDERYAVQNAAKKAVNGDEKTQILLTEGLIKVTAAAPKVEEPAAEAAEEEVAAEETAEESSEESAES